MNRRLAALCLLLAVALTGAACAKKSASSGHATGSVTPLAPSPSVSPSAVRPVHSAPAAPSAPAPKPAATISKAAFLAQANAICTTMNTQQSALPDPTTSAQALDELHQAAAITQDAVARLRALPEPAGDAPTLQAAFAKVDAVNASAQREIAAIAAGNTALAQQIDNQTTALNDTANQAFNAYGMTVCGQP